MSRALANLRSFVVFLVVGGGLAASGLVLGARWHWAGELAASFRWQLAGCGLLSAVLLALLRARRAALAVLALALWLGWPGASLWLPRSGPLSAGTPLRVATVNAFMGNRDAAKLLSFVREADAAINSRSAHVNASYIQYEPDALKEMPMSSGSMLCARMIPAGPPCGVR